VARKAQRWNPERSLSKQEEGILRLCKKHKLYSFFRMHRHEILDEEVQERLLETYSSGGHGDAPIPPAQLALAMLMQAAFGEPDHEVPTLTAVDRRWQMVLGCLDREKPLFCQGTVYNFRMRAIVHELAPMLVDKTVELARQTRSYSSKKLRVAFDSSPLSGAARVEDTFNLIGHAASEVVRTAAKRLDKSPEDVAQQAGIPLLNASSLKCGLDLDWDQPDARAHGLKTLLSQVDALHQWLKSELSAVLDHPPMKEQWETIERIIEQDTEPDPEGGGGRRITQGTARDRQISITDPEMRHGRKTRSQTIKGFKRHIALDLEIPGLICATKVTAANIRDYEVVECLLDRLESQDATVVEAHVDRAYVDSPELIERRKGGLAVITKPHPLGSRHDVLTKAEFRFNFSKKTITCPAGVVGRFKLGSAMEFPAEKCDCCELRPRCTKRETGRGRSVFVNRNEKFQNHLRRQSKTPTGRAERRERVKVEHGLARIKHIQGDRARFKGIDKNDFDLACRAVVNNCYLLGRLWEMRKAA